MNNYCVLKAAEVTRKNFVKIYVEFYVVMCILISNQTSRGKEREEYGQLLLSLEREYSREGRRIDRVRKPEEDRR